MKYGNYTYSIARDTLLGNTVILDEADSTQNFAKSALSDRLSFVSAEPFFVLAKRQTAGRGRMGRSFVSPSGGLYFSLVLQPDNAIEPGLLTTSAAVAISGALSRLFPERCEKAEIKWVNDILLDRKKLCGILTEGIFSADKPPVYILGLGLNLFEPKNGFSPEIADIATSVFMTGAPSEDELSDLRFKVLRAFADEFFPIYAALRNYDGATALPPHFNSYLSRCSIEGQNITYIKNDKRHFAAVKKLLPDFSLLISEDGKDEVLFTGEVSVRKV